MTRSFSGWTSSRPLSGKWRAPCSPAIRRPGWRAPPRWPRRRGRASRRCCGCWTRLGFGSYPEFQQRLRDEVTRSMSESPLSRARARQAVPSDDSVFLRAVEQRAGLVARLQDTVPPAEIERAVVTAGRAPEARRHLRRVLLAVDRPHAGDAARPADPQRRLRRRAARRRPREVPAPRPRLGRDRLRPAPLRTGGQGGRLAGEGLRRQRHPDHRRVALPVGGGSGHRAARRRRRRPVRLFRRAPRAHRKPGGRRLPRGSARRRSSGWPTGSDQCTSTGPSALKAGPPGDAAEQKPHQEQKEG